MDITMDTVIVFTAKSIQTMIERGGSGNWKLNAARVKKECKYVVMSANSHHKKSSHQNSKHGGAFLIGKVSGLSPEAYDDLGEKADDRWVIQFSEYAEIEVPGVWRGDRNPVRYADLAELAIAPESLDWKPFPIDEVLDLTHLSVSALTIEEAKLGLSKTLGVSPEAIEITIRA